MYVHIKDEPIQTVTVKVREQLHQLKVKFEKHKSKNVEVFISAEQVSILFTYSNTHAL